MAIEVFSEAIFEINYLDYLCSHVSLASKCLDELNETTKWDQISPINTPLATTIGTSQTLLLFSRSPTSLHVNSTWPAFDFNGGAICYLELHTDGAFRR